jgi:hypothetical protein
LLGAAAGCPQCAPRALHAGAAAAQPVHASCCAAAISGCACVRVCVCVSRRMLCSVRLCHSCVNTGRPRAARSWQHVPTRATSRALACTCCVAVGAVVPTIAVCCTNRLRVWFAVAASVAPLHPPPSPASCARGECTNTLHPHGVVAPAWDACCAPVDQPCCCVVRAAGALPGRACAAQCSVHACDLMARCALRGECMHA